MFNFDVNALADSIKPAAEKVTAALGTSLDSLWTFGVQGQRAEGIAYLALSVLFIVVNLFLVWALRWYLKKDDGSADVGAALVMSCTVFFVISSIVVPLLIYYSVMHIAAPEWMLLQEILSVVKSS